MASRLGRKVTIPSSFYYQHEGTEDLIINDFSGYAEGSCDVIRASNDLFYSTICALKFFPNGNCPENEGFVSVEFIKYIRDPDLQLIVKCVISVVDNEGNSRLFQSFTHDSTDRSTVFGIDRFVKRSMLLERSDEFLPDDKLHIRCEISYTIKSDDSSHIPEQHGGRVKIPIKFCDDEKEEEKVYFNIETEEGKNHKLPLEKDVNKTALCRKSPVFARMLSTAMSEKSNRKVYIKDINHTTLLNLLSYVNSESFMTNSVQETVDLYIAADKYQVLGLRAECATDLLRNMTAENVCNILTLADMHNDEKLKSFSISFINFNKENVMESDSFLDLAEKNPHLLQEIEFVPVSSNLDDEKDDHNDEGDDENLHFYS